MAFDLNKSDGSKEESSKFDLSKREIEKPAGQSRGWLIGLFGILVVGGGIWYYASGKADPAAKASAANVSSDPASVVIPAAPTKEKVSSVDTTAVAQVNSTAIQADPIRKTSLNTAPAKLQTKALKALNHTVPVTFLQGSSSFASTNKTLIKRIVVYMIKNPTVSIRINGYASSDGPIGVNQQISQARADTFKNHLTALNIEASRISTIGKGIENPIASNKTVSGRKKNRRVEITLL